MEFSDEAERLITKYARDSRFHNAMTYLFDNASKEERKDIFDLVLKSNILSAYLLVESLYSSDNVYITKIKEYSAKNNYSIYELYCAFIVMVCINDAELALEFWRRTRKSKDIIGLTFVFKKESINQKIISDVLLFLMQNGIQNMFWKISLCLYNPEFIIQNDYFQANKQNWIINGPENYRRFVLRVNSLTNYSLVEEPVFLSVLASTPLYFTSFLRILNNLFHNDITNIDEQELFNKIDSISNEINEKNIQQLKNWINKRRIK